MKQVCEICHRCCAQLDGQHTKHQICPKSKGSTLVYIDTDSILCECTDKVQWQTLGKMTRVLFRWSLCQMMVSLCFQLSVFKRVTHYELDFELCRCTYQLPVAIQIQLYCECAWILKWRKKRGNLKSKDGKFCSGPANNFGRIFTTEKFSYMYLCSRRANVQWVLVSFLWSE